MAKIIDPDDLYFSPNFYKFGFEYFNGEFHKEINGVHYVIYQGIMMGIEGLADYTVYTYLIRNERLVEDDIIIRGTPDRVLAYLIQENRDKIINKIIE